MAIQGTNTQPSTSTIVTTTESRTYYRTLFHKGGRALLLFFISCTYVPGRIHSLHFPFLETTHFVNTGHMHHLGIRGYIDVKSS